MFDAFLPVIFLALLATVAAVNPDTNEQCQDWASIGECDKASGFCWGFPKHLFVGRLNSQSLLLRTAAAAAVTESSIHARKLWSKLR